MILYKNKQAFDKAKTTDVVDLICPNCGKEFHPEKRDVNRAIKRKQEYKTCSPTCREAIKGNKPPQKVNCKTCGKEFKKTYGSILVTGNNFCSRLCSNAYNNRERNMRSKTEIILEKYIRKNYPNIKLVCNDISAIYLEIDLYFPELNYGIELNGITHYKPIYGKERLKRIQASDRRKKERAKKKGIKLDSLNTSHILNYTEEDKLWLYEKIDIMLKEHT